MQILHAKERATKSIKWLQLLSFFTYLIEAVIHFFFILSKCADSPLFAHRMNKSIYDKVMNSSLCDNALKAE